MCVCACVRVCVCVRERERERERRDYEAQRCTPCSQDLVMRVCFSRMMCQVHVAHAHTPAACRPENQRGDLFSGQTPYVVPVNSHQLLQTGFRVWGLGI